MGASSSVVAVALLGTLLLMNTDQSIQKVNVMPCIEPFSFTRDVNGKRR